MIGHPQMRLLNGNYTLIKPTHQGDDHLLTSSWSGVDKIQDEYLIRLWTYDATKVQRALWDHELRKLYRVSSMPGAENYLLRLHDAGVDESNRCFVMVTVADGFGYTPLSQLLRSRDSGTWLDTRKPEIRQRIWLGLSKIVRGIDILHSQDVFHRNVCAENVLVQEVEGPESFHLGGFEWSIRIGNILNRFSQGDEIQLLDKGVERNSVFQFEDDWYEFGMLVARCLINVESCYVDGALQRDFCTLSKVQSATGTYLTEAEKSLILRLISPDSIERLAHSHQIFNDIQEIINSLDVSAPSSTSMPTLVLTYSQNYCDDIRDQAMRAGWQVNPSNSLEEFNPLNRLHLASLNDFLRKDLHQAQIYFYREDQHILVGENMSLMVRKVRLHDAIAGESTESWDAAYVPGTANYLYSNPELNIMQNIPAGAIEVMTIGQCHKNLRKIKNRISWQRYLPSREAGLKLRENMRRLYDFVICMNQFELLFRDAELFQYVVKKRDIDSQFETIIISEAPRKRKPISKFTPQGGLIEYLQREMDRGGDYSKLVHLTQESNDSLRTSRNLVPSEYYTIVSINEDDNTICLRRAFRDKDSLAPENGWVKSFGMRGQIGVIRRRQHAIHRLRGHTYLLKSIISTGETYIDTGIRKLPLPISPEKIDGVKQAVMQDILRTRPIYALQGPPGTGKTTLVAHLVRQIFEDDPVAQILITAQAHGAVNVLQRKVVDEAFSGVEKPLAIRLGIKSKDEMNYSESLVNVSTDILDQVLLGLQGLDELSDLQLEWQAYVQSLRRMIDTTDLSAENPEEASEFIELVKRSANIVYSTTNAGDLEILSRDTRQFDWSIIEEAGKCHAFDLVLPMQIGHRWLLIGDQKQLEPYRIEDYYEYAIDNMLEMVAALKELPDRAGGLLDYGWIERWESMDLAGKQDFHKFCIHWAYTFRTIFDNCCWALNKLEGYENTIDEEERVYTRNESIGAIAGKLAGQYRMHPIPGKLISNVYYDGQLINRTVDEETGAPVTRVLLKFTSPHNFNGVGLIWVDTPPAYKSDIAKEGGGNFDTGMTYTNRFEVDVINKILRKIELDPEFLNETQTQTKLDKPFTLSILSPYSQQVRLLRKNTATIDIPVGIKPQEELAYVSPEQTRLVHTVDSFQGNEADIVIISLVRNNENASSGRHPLGFLRNEKRMNVLLSRAKRLMILVGSWEFFCESIDTNDRDSTHIANALSMIEQWFNQGKAKRVNALDFLGR